MGHTNKTIIHIARRVEADGWTTLAMCGTDMDGDSDDIACTLTELDTAPIEEDTEILCPLCQEHPDYPLLVLAHVGN